MIQYRFDEMMSLPVPQRYYPLVLEFLGELLRHQGTPGSASVQLDGVAARIAQRKPPPIDWTNVGNFRILRSELHHLGALTMLDLAASRPQVPVSVSEIVRVSGCSYAQVRSHLGYLSRVLSRRFIPLGGQDTWPVEVRHSDDGRHMTSYVMRPAVAKAWRQSA